MGDGPPFVIDEENITKLPEQIELSASFEVIDIDGVTGELTFTMTDCKDVHPSIFEFN